MDNINTSATQNLAIMSEYANAWAQLDLWVAKKEASLKSYAQKKNASKVKLAEEQEILNLLDDLKTKVWNYIRIVDYQLHDHRLARKNAEVELLIIWKKYEEEFRKHIKQDING